MPQSIPVTNFDDFSSMQIAKQKSAYIVKTARSVTVTNILAPVFALLLFYDDADPIKLSIWLCYMAVATFIRTWVPAMIVTADTSPSHIQYFSKLNIPVLHKPVSFQQVISVVESKLSEHAKSSTPT